MSYRNCFAFACLAVVGVTYAEDYEVTVPMGTTNRIDAAFVEALGSKDLVKKGRGVLWSSSAMANYAGKITVEEGALMVSGPSDLGTTAGGTEVKSGATLIIYTDAGVEGSAGNDGLAFSEGFTVGGTGDAQWGAAIYQPPVGYSQQKAFGSSVSLTEDTTFSMGVRAGFTGGELYMCGHTLTLRDGTFNFQRSRITPRPSSNVGDIVVEQRGTFQIGGTVSGQFGDPACTVTVKDGASLTFYDATQVPVWRLLVEEGGKVGVNGSSAATANAVWGGDVVWNSSAVGASVITRADGGTLTIKGNVTGTGKMYANCGTVVFEKDVSIGGFDVSGTAVVNLPSSDRYWGHGGMMIGYRSDGWNGGYDTARTDTAWSYCAEGPGPQLSSTYWPNTAKQSFCSRGYIWNREATNVTYSVFVGVPYENYLYLDGANVYYNKRDNWGNSYAMTLTPGPHSIDIRTIANGVNPGGPRSDNDKPKMNGVIMQDSGNGYLFTTDTVDRATVLLEHSHKLSNIARAGSSVLDAGGLPVEITNFTGVPEVANTPACMLKGVWTLTAADINAGKVLNVTEGSFTFDNVTIAIDDVDAITHADHAWRHVICTADEPITGIQTDVVFQGAKRTWKLVLSDNGKELALEYQPNGMTVIVR